MFVSHKASASYNQPIHAKVLYFILKALLCHIYWSKGYSTGYDCITYIAWHHAIYPFMQGYSTLACKPRGSLFTRLFGLPLLQVHGGYNIKLYLLRVMRLAAFHKVKGVPLIMTSSHTIDHTIYLYIQRYGILQGCCAPFTRSWLMGHSNSYDCTTIYYALYLGYSANTHLTFGSF